MITVKLVGHHRWLLLLDGKGNSANGCKLMLALFETDSERDAHSFEPNQLNTRREPLSTYQKKVEIVKLF